MVAVVRGVVSTSSFFHCCPGRCGMGRVMRVLVLVSFRVLVVMSRIHDAAFFLAI